MGYAFPFLNLSITIHIHVRVYYCFTKHFLYIYAITLKSKIHLAWNGVGLSNLVAPISSSHRNNGKFGQDDSPSDCGGNFFGTFHPKTNVAIAISNSNECLPTIIKIIEIDIISFIMFLIQTDRITSMFDIYLEPCALTSSGLLLHRHNLQNLIFQCRQEEINNFKFLK